MIDMFVFDHRPPLALRDVDANPNDPALLAAICRPCNKRKTASDLRAIARARRLAPLTIRVRATASNPVLGALPDTVRERELVERQRPAPTPR